MEFTNKLFIDGEQILLFNEIRKDISWDITELNTLTLLSHFLFEKSKIFEDTRLSIFSRYGNIQNDKWVFDKSKSYELCRDFSKLLSISFIYDYIPLEIKKECQVNIPLHHISYLLNFFTFE